ncbi:putative membrane protein YeaQ/YmgE (transglycosylase-associated protein family) [Rhizobium azibense]|nr:putative membrane protein YeaQ/YmgE (transglycosylase-associated protein family) [Rhizobium azibense]
MIMEGVGWIAAIIIGGLAGWLAGKLMEARYGIVLNIVLGIVGSVVATAVLAQFQIEVAAGRLGYFVTGFLGACLLIFIARLVRR